MTTITHQQVLDNVLSLMTELAGDWEYDGDVSPDTRLLADLALESLGLVVLGTALQERFGRLPFTEFYAEIVARPVGARDVTVGELVDFISSHSERVSKGSRV